MKHVLFMAALLCIPVLASAQDILTIGPPVGVPTVPQQISATGNSSEAGASLTQSFIAERAYLNEVTFWHSPNGALASPTGPFGYYTSFQVWSGVGRAINSASTNTLLYSGNLDSTVVGRTTIRFDQGIALTVGEMYSMVFRADLCRCQGSPPPWLEMTTVDWYSGGVAYDQSVEPENPIRSGDGYSFDGANRLAGDLRFEMIQSNSAVIPEPTTTALLIPSVLLAVFARRRRRTSPA